MAFGDVPTLRLSGDPATHFDVQVVDDSTTEITVRDDCGRSRFVMIVESPDVSFRHAIALADQTTAAVRREHARAEWDGITERRGAA